MLVLASDFSSASNFSSGSKVAQMPATLGIKDSAKKLHCAFRCSSLLMLELRTATYSSSFMLAYASAYTCFGDLLFIYLPVCIHL